MRPVLGCVLACLVFVSCRQSISNDNPVDFSPDWRTFRSTATEGGDVQRRDAGPRTDGLFTLGDLKKESDASLANRLLGQLGSRIVYIDRHRSRWRYYNGDSDTISHLTLFSRPQSWGSAFGICGTEKYEISFTESGEVESVQVTPRFGVEGPIFQRRDFDWDYARGRMCNDVPANHTPSYFPAPDAFAAHDLAILLSMAIDLAGQPGPLPFELSCSGRGESCAPGLRQYLAELRLSDIDDTSQIGCTRIGDKREDCYTVTVGQGQLGPFPKRITIRGSTYMNDWKVRSVTVREGFTME